MNVNWDSHVNTRFYKTDGSYNDNREEVEYASGRKIFYLKNSLPSKTHSVNLRLQDYQAVNGKTEFQWFLSWYETTCASGTNSFYLTDFIMKSGFKLYRLADIPKWDGQRYKVVKLELEEV